MISIILLILCVLVTTLIGWNVLFLLSGRKGLAGFSFLEQAGLSYLLGTGVITVQMFIMSIIGIGYTRFSIFIPWVVVMMGTGLIIWRSGSKKPVPILAFPPRVWRPFELVLICLITLQTLYNFFRALIRPIEAHDAVAIYGIKSKMIYLAGGITGEFFTKLASNFHGAHPDYPLLVPLSEVWVYTFLGQFNDILVKAIFPLSYLAFLFVFYAVLKRITEKPCIALLFTFLLATVKQFADFATIGVADLWLGIYFTIGILYLYLWFAEKKAGFLNISLLSIILAVWTKNEGMLLALIAVIIFLIYVAANFGKIKKQELAGVFAYPLLVILAIFSWSAFKHGLGLVNENFNFSMVNFGNLMSGLSKIPAILYEYQKQFFGPNRWNIIWILFFVVFVKEFKRVFSGDIKYVTLIFLLFALGYGSMYIFSTVGLGFFLTTTGSRFLLHILPVTVFWMALILDKHELTRI